MSSEVTLPPFRLCAAIGEKDAEDKDLNSEAPSSPSEATSEKDANSVSNAVSSKKEEERSNSIKKVIRVEILHVFTALCHKGALQFGLVYFMKKNIRLAVFLSIF